jgi:hypothetical protein
MSYKIKNFLDTKEDYFLWDKLINKSSDHWYFSSVDFNYFHIEYLKEQNLFVDNNSFFIYENEELVALTILIFSKDKNSNLLNASYHENYPLPWPIISDECKNRDYVYQLIFNEIHKRIEQNKIASIKFILNSPVFSKKIEDEFIKILLNYNMIDNSYNSHFIELNDLTLNKIRKSYIKNIKRNINKFSVKIIQKDNYYKKLSEDYKLLHTQDRGKEVRSLKSYDLQLQAVKKNKAFVVQIFSNEDQLIGMLIIFLEKNSAYDGSVAVCPHYKKFYISHLLKYNAILELNKRNIKFYELGKAAITPSYNYLPTEKNYKISFFKNGWSNNIYKKVFVAEKIFNSDSLKYFTGTIYKKLYDFFKIK